MASSEGSLDPTNESSFNRSTDAVVLLADRQVALGPLESESYTQIDQDSNLLPRCIEQHHSEVLSDILDAEREDSCLSEIIFEPATPLKRKKLATKAASMLYKATHNSAGPALSQSGPGNSSDQKYK